MLNRSRLDGSNRFILSVSRASSQIGSITLNQPVSLEKHDPSTVSTRLPFQTDSYPANLESEIAADQQRLECPEESDVDLPLKSILGIDGSKILSFSLPEISPRRSATSKGELSSRPTVIPFQVTPVFGTIPVRLPTRPTANNFSRNNRSNVPRYSPFRVLDAPGLRNDFYSNLISWSSESNSVAVGLGRQVYIWNKVHGVSLVKIDNKGLITSVSFSTGDFLLIGTLTGRLWLISQELNKVIATTLRKGSSICCIQWSSNNTVFFVGDSCGVVTCYETLILSRYGDKKDKQRIVSISPLSSLRFHRQQICGIALNKEETEIAVGANDNYCTVWDLSDIESPTLKHLLPHKAAVKAISYCPWSKSLLATGGGTKDRNIRFWHTTTGTLLKAYDTKYQITSLIWSTSCKEFLVTFGFGDGIQKIVVSGYSFPSLTPIFEVNVGENLRVLSAVLAPDKESICVATNDETIRFYKIWKSSSLDLISSGDVQSFAVYGSPLIEMYEGVDKRGESIR